MNLTVGVLLSLAGAIGNALTEAGLLDAQGNFMNPTPEAIGKAAQAVEEVLKAKGLVVPKNIDKAIQILPLVLSF